MLARLRESLGGSGFVRNRSGQDLVEYALLMAFLGTIAAAATPTIQTAISAAYASWNTGTQDLWQPPNPGAGS
jgi:Flp pilus assembly pilin Flp